MNQMTPTEFRDRLRSAMPDASADGPLPSAVAADVAVGRRLLRRRRGATVLGAAAVVAMAGGGLGLASGLGNDPVSAGTGVAAASAREAKLLEACGSETSPEAYDAIFGSGAPVVKAQAETDQQVVLAIESADGKYWAECLVSLVPAAELESAMTVYDASKRSWNIPWGEYTLGCPVHGQELCSGVGVNVADRRSPEVAAVEFLTSDGKITRVETDDGYYAFSYGVSFPEGSEVPIGQAYPVLKQITFLDAKDQPIAAEVQDGSGVGEDADQVAGLPTLREFPSLRSEEPIGSEEPIDQ